jgi:hypothetical protein
MRSPYSGRRAEAAQEIKNRADILSEPMRGLRPAFEGDWQVLALEKHGPQRIGGRGDLALTRVFGVGRSRRQRRRPNGSCDRRSQFWRSGG